MLDVYYKYSDYLKNKYGDKVYKIPINLPVTCPNRDGNVAYGGCTYCGDVAAGYEMRDAKEPISMQLTSNINKIREKYKAIYFIPYLQNFSNTYMPIDKFKAILEELVTLNVVGISISTRPDCISTIYLEALKDWQTRYHKDVCIELGLQTIQYKSLKRINRGHTLAEYLDAVMQIKAYGFEICTHIIVDLPYDDLEDVIETAKCLSALKITYVKLHALYIVKHTVLAKEYEMGQLQLVSYEDYKERVITFLRYLSPNIVVQRIIGRAPEGYTLIANWNKSWRKIHDEVVEEMRLKGYKQGDLCHYLGGRALNIFNGQNKIYKTENTKLNGVSQEMKLPVAFETKMKHLLGKEEYEAYLKSFELPNYQGLRINTLKITLEDWKRINPFQSLKPVPWCQEGFYYNLSERPTKHPYYFAGLYYIQEPSAMSPGAYLPIESGDKILDMCAAPGGKSTQLAVRMQQEGVLISNDISASRTKALLKNLENFGSRNVIITNETSERLAEKWKGYFDKILIDAPCSGEGMFRKNESAVKSWEAYGVQHCMKLQEAILEDAVMLLKPNGMILYSTCTFSPEENEGMIDQFLKKHSDFKIVPLKPVGGIQHGRPEFIDASNQLKGALRLWPHHLEGEGHFLCLLQRTDGASYSCNYYKPSLTLKDYPEAWDFMQNYTYISGDISVMEINGRLYHIPEGAPDLKGMRIVRGGLLLGELKRNRFEPSHALALAYDKEMYRQTINWSVDNENVMRYLKGETILCDKPKGYYVVCVEGYPLGWIKSQNGLLKNQYPPSWRVC